MHDILIIGAGPAGLAAAMYAARAGLKTLLVGRPQDSGLYSAHNVQNYPGFPDGISGPELMNLFVDQARKHGAEIETGKEVVSVKSQGVPALGVPGTPSASAIPYVGYQIPYISIVLDTGEEYVAKRILIASGRVPALSGIKGEKELRGKGVHYCVVCDGPLYKGKKVAVVGSKDYALQEAKELLSYTNDVTVISHAPAFEARAERKEELENASVRFVVARVKEFVTDIGTPDFPSREVGSPYALQSLILDSGEEQTYDAVFVALGSASALSFAQALGLETRPVRSRMPQASASSNGMEGLPAEASAQAGGHLKIDRATGRTSVEGVYAAGCACEEGYGQISKSAGEGTTAAIEIIKDLKGLKSYVDHT